MMAYTLSKLAPGSYDIELDGELIAGLVRTELSNRYTWIAELLEPLPLDHRPAPFTALEHQFPTLEAALEWLGGAEVKSRREAA
jgi:hypothetical protein